MRSHTVPASKQRTATLVGSQSVPAQDRHSWISSSCALHLNLQDVASTGRCRSTGRTHHKSGQHRRDVQYIRALHLSSHHSRWGSTAFWAAFSAYGSSDRELTMDMALECPYQRLPRSQGRGRQAEHMTREP